jgi:hypothetical protein
MYIIASTTYFEDANKVGVIPAPNLTPIFQIPTDYQQLK